jgi:hypothetical protein
MGYPKYKILNYNQHKNNMCHAQSVEKNICFGAPTPLITFSPYYN